MKRYDFTKTGGFPLSQNRAAWMQDGYITAINAMAGVCGGVDPVVLYGVELTSGGWLGAGAVSDGWIWHPVWGVMPFIGGNVLNLIIPFGTSTTTVAVVEDLKTPLTFKNNAAQLVEINRVCRLVQKKSVGVNDIDVQLLSGRRWYLQFQKQGREQAWTSLGVVSSVNGNMFSFEKKIDGVAHLLKLRGTISVNAGLPAPYNYSVYTIPNLPAADLDFVGVVRRISGTTYPIHSITGDQIKNINGRVFTNGNIQFELEPSASAYLARFNCVLNLD